MKTLKTQLIAALWLLSLHLAAQNSSGVDVQISESNKEPATSFVYDLIGGNEDGYYITRMKQNAAATLLLGNAVGQSSGDIIIEKYDKKLNLTQSKILEHQIKGEKLSYSTAFLFGSRLYGLADAYFRSQDKKAVYFQEINTKNLTTPGDPVEMMVLENIEKIRHGNFSIMLSPDESLIAIVGFPNSGNISILDSKKQKEPATILASVYDSKMNQLWNSEFQLEYQEKDYSILKAEIDNDGNFYWLGKKDEGKVAGNWNYTYFINKYTGGRNEATQITIELEDKLINDCSFSISPEGEIVVSGFYAENDITDIKGVFYTRINSSTKSSIKTSFKEFDTEFMSEFMSERKAKKGKELDNFEFSELISREDGGAVLLAEKYYVTTSTTTDSQGNTRTTYTYHYNEIIVTNINPSGDIDWSIRIPKKQGSSGTAYLSYTSMVSNDKIFLVFNDNPKNLIETKEDKVHAYNGKSSIAMLVTIDADGKWYKSELFDNKEEGVILRPIICNQINENETLFYAEKGRTYKLGLFKF